MNNELKRLKIIGYTDGGTRSLTVARACVNGAKTLRLSATLKSIVNFNGAIEADIVVFYGLQPRFKLLFDLYVRNQRHCIFVDLGYFGRMQNGKLNGYHRVSVNELFPTTIFTSPFCESLTYDRASIFNLDLKPPRNDGKYLLLAGMSAKSAHVNGYLAEQYETEIISAYSTSKYPIVYRPKPSWPEARPLKGALYSPPEQALTDVLTGARCVITHHSNVAIDGLIEGIPCIVQTPSPAKFLSGNNPETAVCPDIEVRKKWLSKLAYAQWNLEEMENGLMWKFLLKSGLIHA